MKLVLATDDRILIKVSPNDLFWLLAGPMAPLLHSNPLSKAKTSLASTSVNYDNFFVSRLYGSHAYLGRQSALLPRMTVYTRLNW